MSSYDMLDSMIGAAAKKAAKKSSSPKKSASKSSSPKASSSGSSGGKASGVVVSYNPARGFGFIKDDSKDVDYFFHKSQLVISGIDNVKAGDKLSFDVQGKGDDCKKGNCAINIKMMKGGQKGGMGGYPDMANANSDMNELFHRLLSLNPSKLDSFAQMANLNSRYEGMPPMGMQQMGMPPMMGGGKKMSKLALVNLLLS